MRCRNSSCLFWGRRYFTAIRRAMPQTKKLSDGCRKRFTSQTRWRARTCFVTAVSACLAAASADGRVNAASESASEGGLFPGNPARTSYGASMLAPGSRYRAFEDRCCQICPARFMSTLSFMQVSESDKQTALRNFAAWHRTIAGAGGTGSERPHGESQDPQFFASADSSEVKTMASSSSSSTVGSGSSSESSFIDATDLITPVGIRPIPPLYSIEPGPCCPICPSFFMNRYNDQRKEGTALSFHRQEGDSYYQGAGAFVEVDRGDSEKWSVDGQSEGSAQTDRASTHRSGWGDSGFSSSPRGWRKKGRGPHPARAKRSERTPTNSDEFVEVAATSSLSTRVHTRKIDFPELQCCNVCASQFFPPLEYDDEELPQLVMGPGTKMGFIPTQKAETQCCEACSATLQPRQRQGVKAAGMDDGSSSSYPKKAENFKTMKTMYVPTPATNELAVVVLDVMYVCLWRPCADPVIKLP